MTNTMVFEDWSIRFKTFTQIEQYITLKIKILYWSEVMPFYSIQHPFFIKFSNNFFIRSVTVISAWLFCLNSRNHSSDFSENVTKPEPDCSTFL